MSKLASTLLLLSFPLLATEPNPATRRWWSYTEALASDNMQGRETGTAGYRQAENFVIAQFTKAGLSPAGTDGFKQPVPLHSLKLQPDASPVRLVRTRSTKDIEWFRQITVAVHPNLPKHISGPLYFVGDPATVQPERVAGGGSRASRRSANPQAGSAERRQTPGRHRCSDDNR